MVFVVVYLTLGNFSISVWKGSDDEVFSCCFKKIYITEPQQKLLLTYDDIESMTFVSLHEIVLTRKVQN